MMLCRVGKGGEDGVVFVLFLIFYVFFKLLFHVCDGEFVGFYIFIFSH